MKRQEKLLNSIFEMQWRGTLDKYAEPTESSSSPDGTRAGELEQKLPLHEQLDFLSSLSSSEPERPQPSEKRSTSDMDGNEHEGWKWTGVSTPATPASPRHTFSDDDLKASVVDELRERRGEVRTTDPDTGAMKGRKDVELFTAPPLGLQEYGRVCSYGSNGKYAQNNWRLGFTWSLSANALLRHYIAWAGGEDRDPESGLHHLAHAAWHCLVLVQYAHDHPEKDDRFGMPADPATGGQR